MLSFRNSCTLCNIGYNMSCQKFQLTQKHQLWLIYYEMQRSNMGSYHKELAKKSDIVNFIQSKV